MAKGGSGKKKRGRRRAGREASGTHGASSGRGVATQGRPLQFTRLNWILLGAAAIVIAIGYALLATASPLLSTVIAPIVLVAGYAVLIPLGLIL